MTLDYQTRLYSCMLILYDTSTDSKHLPNLTESFTAMVLKQYLKDKQEEKERLNQIRDDLCQKH